jgi:hexulose-6-phosphate isomerase
MNRREFLKRATNALPLAAMVPSALATEEKPARPRTVGEAKARLLDGQSAKMVRDAVPRRIKKGIMWDTVGVKGSVLERMRAIKEAGFEGVEMMSHMDQEEVLRARDETGLVIPSVCGTHHWGKPLSDPNPKVREEGLEALKQTLRDGKRYGATSVLLVPAVVNETVSYADAYTRSQVEIRKAVPLAEELGVKIAIENVWNQFLLSPLEAARYVDEFNSPAVGWHFDVGNVITYGWPEQWIRILGKRIQKLHIKEFSRKKRDKEGLWKGFDVPFLEGDNNWPAIMKALDDIGYHGWGIAEQGGGDTPAGLKDLSERMSRIFAS